MLKRIRVIQGGQGASKTFTILLKIIDQCILREDTSCTIFQYELTKMKRTVIRDFKKIMKETNNWVPSEWNGSSSTYTFSNGSYIEFVGLSDAEIGKGFRRDIVYFNEANKGILFESYQQVASRAKIVYIDFNPDREFWVHREVLIDENAEFIIINFTHNECLPQNEVDSILDYKKKGFINPDLENYDIPSNIKSEYWANKWRVYGLGLVGTLEGQIYKWQVIQSIPPEAELLSYGLDFGFNDPTVLVELYKYGSGYIINERLYKDKLDPEDLKREILALNLNSKITIRADGSRPELIKSIEKLKLSIEPVDKNQKNDRILLLSAENIQVTRSSTNVIREMSGYVWKKAPDGSNKDVPIEIDDHSMDAALYSADKVIIRIKKRSSSWGGSTTA
ncbi:phage terminase large subunit [Flavobacterium sp. SUN046]|uniref:phage terminase large subunit n=1 Tax=Flavobacterium sp. SUN046 TaxID=3002440 RepID=UPI002DBE8D33|nr:phage terminase large subunit [Flavobacterium sp. SUN046]MEC4050654.1 phage terminase large subunit [Flavobacterium sp. SUN046]